LSAGKIDSLVLFIVCVMSIWGSGLVTDTSHQASFPITINTFTTGSRITIATFTGSRVSFATYTGSSRSFTQISTITTIMSLTTVTSVNATTSTRTVRTLKEGEP